MGSNLFYYLSMPYFVLPTFLTDISDIFCVQLGRDIIKENVLAMHLMSGTGMV